MEIVICNRTVKDIPQLIHALFYSPLLFYSNAYIKLVNPTAGADLYEFLNEMGYRELVQDTQQQTKKLSEHDAFVVWLTTLETIATQCGIDTSIIINFYRNFGPGGLASYVKSLVEDQKNPIYTPLNATGSSILKKVMHFRPTAATTITDLHNAYRPLIDQIQYMRTHLEDNPYSIQAGTYDNVDIICSNLKGCFAFWIFGTPAPLGFERIISTNGGH